MPEVPSCLRICPNDSRGPADQGATSKVLNSSCHSSCNSNGEHHGEAGGAADLQDEPTGSIDTIPNAAASREIRTPESSA
jgi:hypothetical protein